jgi:aldose 1-epimerase
VWTLCASDGSIEVRVTEFGAALVGCRVRDATGQMLEVLQSPQSAGALAERKECWYGAVIGRYANRIRNATFSANNGTVYQLDANEGKHHLHGGADGWGRRMWTPTDAAESPESASGSTMAFTLVSQGLPVVLTV